MVIQNIDKGSPFDWGKTSEDYAKYRDIYPQQFYDYILELGLCKDGQKVLDIGTGTGVIPSNMYKYGAKWTGIDIAENQIRQAKLEEAEIKEFLQYLKEINGKNDKFAPLYWKKLLDKMGAMKVKGSRDFSRRI